MANEKFKKKMIKEGKKLRKEIKKRQTSDNKFDDSKKYDDPYNISSHGDVYSSPFTVQLNFTDGKYENFELISND